MLLFVIVLLLPTAEHEVLLWLLRMEWGASCYATGHKYTDSDNDSQDVESFALQQQRHIIPKAIKYKQARINITAKQTRASSHEDDINLQFRTNE